MTIKSLYKKNRRLRRRNKGVNLLTVIGIGLMTLYSLRGSVNILDLLSLLLSDRNSKLLAYNNYLNHMVLMFSERMTMETRP